MWRIARRTLGRYKELILAATFLGMAGYEAVEMWLLEGRRPQSLSLTIHSLQVVVILAATALAVRAWQRKTAHQEALARLVEQVVFAQEEERRRVAYELHDGISPLIVSAKQHLDTARDLWPLDSERAERQLDVGLERLRQAIVETRHVLSALRPSAVISAGLVPAARRSVEDAAAEAGWTSAFRENLGDQRLPPVVETAAFRILQEALANARKHARSERVDVALNRYQDWLDLDVRDYGVGLGGAAEPAGRGLGLVSMRERARLVGGTCEIESGAQGLRVHVRLPLRPEA